MAFIYDLTDTWNNAGISFNGIKLNVTDTASAAGSKLVDIQIGGVSKFTVGKTGTITATGIIESASGGFRFPDGTIQTTSSLGIVGPQGPQGIQGEVGPQGPQGIQGIQGEVGPKGDTGDTGATGPQGIQGIQGIQGPQGDAGPQGDTGLTGPTGPQGPEGPQGIQGIQGDAGPQGPIGPEGPQGIQGIQGEQGAGLVILGTLASTAELPATGTDGDAYLIDGDLWVWVATAWENVGNIQGPQGEAGAQGPQGPQGIQGETGPQGIQGNIGPEGPQGIQGVKGDTGDTGPAGPQGIQGDIGPQGPQGIQGIQGDTGATGPTGPEGPQGIQGIQGETGLQGPQGIQGEQGIQGNTGPAGPGIAAGGAVGQFIRKATTTDYATEWATLSTVALTGAYADLSGAPTLVSAFTNDAGYLTSVNLETNVTGTLPITSGGTGAITAATARSNLGAAASGANADITSMTAITGGISSPDFVQFDTAATVTPAAGRLYFNDGEGGLSYGLKGGNVIQEVGQSQQLLVYNGTGAALTKGQVVYSNGAQGQRPTVALALANSDATSARTIGIVAEPIANGAEGWVSTFGIVENIDTSAFTEGSQLYLSGTVSGGLTSTKPYAPIHMVYVARCIKSNATAGRLFVTIQNGYEMDELHNVSAQSPASNDGLFYNTTTSLWEKKSIITALGYTPYDATNPNGYTSNTGTVTSVSGTGTVSGLTLTGTVTTTGSLTLGGTLSLTSGNVTTALGYTPYNATNPSGYLSTVSLTTNVTGTLPIANGGTGATTAANALTSLGAYPASNPNGYTSNTGTVTGVTGTAPIVSSGGTAPAISISAATTIAAGSMSAADKTKLDGIATNANNYVLPKATATSLGGVEVFDATVQTVAANAVTSTASRTYGIQLNAADQMVVNVPWVDTTGSGTVTSVGGTGTVNGITLTGTVTSSGSLTLGGTLSGVSLTTQVSGTLPVANGGTGVTTSTGTGNVVLSASPTFTGTVTTATTDLLGSVRSNITAVAASAIDCSAGNFFTKTAAGALTWTATNIPASRAFSFLLELTNGGTGTQTWFAGIKWSGGTAPTLTAAGVDMLGFVTDDGGTTWRGVMLMKDSK